MRSVLRPMAPLAVLLALAACTQTSLLRPASGDGASATVVNPILLGTAQLSVVLDGKTYTGLAGEARHDTTGEQARRFGWDPEHKHPHIKQEMKFLFGSTALMAADGTKLECEHLRHGDDWRLRCKTAEGKDIALYRVKQ